MIKKDFGRDAYAILKSLLFINTLVIAVLVLASMLCKPYLENYSQGDIEFAHCYAEEMGNMLEALSCQAEEAGARSPEKALSIYHGAEDDFAERKYAAVHFHGALAEDFVYAFTLAEEWAHYAARSIYDTGNDADIVRARSALQKARRELAAIREKDYIAQ